MAVQMTTCPGCGLGMPLSGKRYDRNFHASAECEWAADVWSAWSPDHDAAYELARDLIGSAERL
jgi:hypothetical protein